jgi:hypothetical protein
VCGEMLEHTIEGRDFFVEKIEVGNVMLSLEVGV